MGKRAGSIGQVSNWTFLKEMTLVGASSDSAEIMNGLDEIYMNIGDFQKIQGWSLIRWNALKPHFKYCNGHQL